jgi:two-component system sensor histidine kinase DesK
VTETADRSRLASGLGPWLPWGHPLQDWRRLRPWFAAIWLLYLLQPLVSLHGTRHSAAWLAAAVATLAAFCVIFLVAMASWEKRPALARLGFAALFPFAGALTLMLSGSSADGHVVWIYVGLASGAAGSGGRTTLRAASAVSACYLLFSWLGHDDWPDTLITLIPVVFVCFMMYGLRARMKLMAELRQAREEVAKLAANEERLRLARDMHDLTGQSLSMITLKSELAARLLRRLPAGPDRDRVAEEVQQVAAVSRQTLHDIREAISGYRRPTLAVEIITARTALESAGIAPRDDSALTLMSGTFGPDAETVLAWCLREAVTNVIRHSGARNCYISLTRHDLDGTVSLEVRDDGRGRPEDAPAGTGTGLHGMSERLCAVGGHLELRPAAPGFCLIATVPVRESAAAGAADAASVGGDSAAGVTVTK